MHDRRRVQEELIDDEALAFTEFQGGTELGGGQSESERLFIASLRVIFVFPVRKIADEGLSWRAFMIFSSLPGRENRNSSQQGATSRVEHISAKQSR
jgi:hypothetical protein